MNTLKYKTMKANFKIKKIANGNKGLFINGLFAGIFSEIYGISQFSGLENQIFDEGLCVEFLKTLNPSANIYSAITIAGNQRYLQVSFKPIILNEGVQKIHKHS